MKVNRPCCRSASTLKHEANMRNHEYQTEGGCACGCNRRDFIARVSLAMGAMSFTTSAVAAAVTTKLKEEYGRKPAPRENTTE
jgi:hypothetical protein